MKLFDSFSGSITEFKPLSPNKVSFYLCGPTVYDTAHLGHGRSAVVFDVIRRHFIYKGYEVHFVSNYTDIDDKMIKRAREENISVPELASKIIPKYAEDYGRLNILAPDNQPQATEYIDEMLQLIAQLEEKGHIYTIEGDGVYFDVSRFDEYGGLSKQKLEDLQMGARIDVKDEKRNPYDFVLWKFKKEADEPSWESKWGEGRPGWHIECSAMCYATLGEKFDIHGGGLDLKFPHHECEIAQTQGVYGHGSFAQYWMHNGFITIDKEKMSKSLNNFFTLRDIFEKYDPLIVRFFFLQTHYRSPIDFSDGLLDQSAAGLLRIHDFVRKLKNASLEGSDSSISLDSYRKTFVSAMDEDFNAAGALSGLFDLIKDMNKALDESRLSSGDRDSIISLLTEMDSVFAVIFRKEEELDDDLTALIAEREAARSEKDWQRSDEIREQLLEKGIAVEDTAHGTIWKRV